MYNIRYFPAFRLPENASASDKDFLREMRGHKEHSGARFLNFTRFMERPGYTEAFYFITYPQEWVAHYVQSNYAEIDPLLEFDYRNVSLLDWHDTIHNNKVAQFFEEFRKRGYGNHGILISHQIDHDVFGVCNFCFDTTDHEWREKSHQRRETLRFLSRTLCNAYQKIYVQHLNCGYNITPRERECLYWAASGKKDAEIAQLLNIGKWTVVSHLQNARDKLDCTNRSAAVAKAVSTGIIRLNFQ